MEHAVKTKKNRIHSLDVTRGSIVFFSILMFSIPNGVLSFNRHAEWYGLTPLDIIFPAFITTYGISMAIAYDKGVNKKRLAKRTIRMILFGLIFNMATVWTIDFANLRFTGVLQMFAVLGIVTVLITKFIKKPQSIIAAGLAVFIIHGAILLVVGQGCENNLPQAECNPSYFIDSAVFGENHIYVGGERGHDPEGIPSTFAALGNVLLGFAAGKILLRQKERGAGRKLFIYGVGLIALSYIVSLVIPFGKRLWTPSFGLIAAGITILILAITYVIFDKSKTNSEKGGLKYPVQWVLEAYGRNSFLVYFGKYILYAFLINTTVTIGGENSSLNTLLMKASGSFGLPGELIYTIIIFGFWLIVTLFAHKHRLYLKI